MSGHSKWATIKRKKAGIDAKRGAEFTKCAKEITMAARSGGDPDMNARLRAAVLAAKAINVPNANIERAIKRGTGEIDGVVYEELIYEGYAPGGVAVIIEAATDNRNRTFPELRKIFEKLNGTIGSAGTVAYLFEKKGVITIDKEAVTEDRLMEIGLEAGADDIDDQGDSWQVTTAPGVYTAVVDALVKAKIGTTSNQLAMVPTMTTKVEGKVAEQVLRLVEALEDHDDVQHVWANFEMDDEAMQAL
jgi:YebC/PmpR family DNA-binding regulatory protein